MLSHLLSLNVCLCLHDPPLENLGPKQPMTQLHQMGRFKKYKYLTIRYVAFPSQMEQCNQLPEAQ